jgi:catechol 2,3-dioxygenase-like lactoylglutathione lyase family enzyme
VHLGLVAIVVSEYDPAISFFTGALGFELVEDSVRPRRGVRRYRWNKWDLLGPAAVAG